MVSVLATGYSNIMSVQVDNAGNIYTADMGSNSVYKIVVADGTRTVVESGFNQPSGIAFDAIGNMFVINAGDSKIYTIPPGILLYQLFNNSRRNSRLKSIQRVFKLAL